MRSTQAPLHSAKPPQSEAHRPSRQNKSPQSAPQAPQFAWSLERSTQLALQSDSLPGQVHVPSVQDAVAGHAFPQVPQLPGSVARSMHS